ncbi:MAG: oligosaccharide flippase family protein, partial [Bdellovibrionales bacterium]|nr:oligosaccharide flippase family protein [Bdellovibrionales bacterium]
MSQKLKSDLIWNYGGLVALSLAGLFFNFAIARFYGADVLGRFNQLFAFYIVGSQVAVAGIHHSILRSLAQSQGDSPLEQGQQLMGGLLLVTGMGTLTSITLYLTAPFWSHLLGSPTLTSSLQLLAPAITLFALSKVLLSSLNGLRRMKSFAVGQSLRYLLFLGGVLCCWLFALEERWLMGSFLFVELILIIYLLVCNWDILFFKSSVIHWPILRHHAHFGLRGISSGIMLDLNTRVDVLMLGAFLSDYEVGIYS